MRLDESTHERYFHTLVIKSSWGTWSASDKFESKMSVIVEKDGEEKTIEYWPRARNTVPAYEWVEV